MKQGRRRKRRAALGLAFVMAMMVFAQGCRGQGASKEEGGVSQAQNTNASQGDTAGPQEGPASDAMGRFVEEERALPSEDGIPMGLFAQEDGSILYYDGEIYRSTDQGETWQKEEGLTGRLKEHTSDNSYLMHLAADRKGNLAFIYAELGETEQGEESTDISTKALYVDTEGNAVPIALDDTGEIYPQSLCFSPDGRLFLLMSGNGVGAVQEADTASGQTAQLFTAGRSFNGCGFSGSILAAVSGEEACLYNLEAGELLEQDTVLGEFLASLYGGDSWYKDAVSGIAVTGGETENTIYLATGRGLYRHVLGGTVMEQVIDGNLSSFGRPDTEIRSILQLADGNFLALFGGWLCYYRYDATLPAMPSQQLTVYSLEENSTIRQAISQYQSVNPDVYIRYEVGMDGESGMTWDDAVKNLNTQIMSGNGPDVLVLDGLPVSSYVEKGMLLELGSLITEINDAEGLFMNLMNSMSAGNGVYAVPARFGLPMLAGAREDIEGIDSMSGLADRMESWRQEAPEGLLLGLYREAQVLNLFYRVSAADWMSENGSLDREKLIDFLTQAKRIYQAEQAGITPALEAEFAEIEAGVGGQVRWDVYKSIGSRAIDILFRQTRLAAGILDGITADACIVTGVLDQMENGGFTALSGQCSGVFLPSTVLGVSAGSQNAETACDFVRTVLSREVQESDLGEGLPVNRAAMTQVLTDTSKEGESMVSVFADADGNMITLDMRWPDETEKAALLELVESRTTPALMDYMIESTVTELGVKALNGSATVEETADEILRKIQLYLAE